MKIRFLADADLNKAIVSGVLRREPAIDFLTSHEAGLRKMKDPEVLALAAEQWRVVVSHDVGTMPSHFRAFRDAGKHEDGMALVIDRFDLRMDGTYREFEDFSALNGRRTDEKYRGSYETQVMKRFAQFAKM